MPVRPYVRRVQYYETDMMGVTHHANYIRWMEEARIDLLDQMGFPYAELEARGVRSPVKSLSCDYRRPCTFGDEITVTVSVAAFNGVVLTLAYEMRGAGGETVCTARSEHVFLSPEGRFVRLKRDQPAFFAALEAAARGGESECE
ncbi:MAG: acyl-CoA thioesterase [Firmicutes bacterium]|nr:acyl-CoA thioesterase [Bacillota bacterium]